MLERTARGRNGLALCLFSFQHLSYSGCLRCTLVTSFTAVLFLLQVYLHTRSHTSVEELIVTTHAGMSM